MNKTFIFRIFTVALLSLFLAACGAAGGGQQATDLASTAQSLAATQAALATEQAAPTDAPATVEVVATDEPTAEPAPTEEPTVAPPTSEPEAPAFYTEQFSIAPDNWTFNLIRGDAADFALYADNDVLVFDIQGENVWPYLTYDPYIYTDVRVDARAENLGNNNNAITLICRSNDRGWYEFNVQNSGLYQIYRYDRSANDFILLYNGGVQNLRVGKDTNDYTIICEGDRLTLGVNGKEVRTVEDSFLDEGQVGISVQSFGSWPVLVEVDYITIGLP
jgi:outer membrane murein-binding lipoprotein Lpp